MSANNARISATAESSQWDLVLTRTFDAPRELVSRAWTDPKHVAGWWGPNGFTNPVCEVDARVGGEMRIHMRAPNGVVYPMKGVFEEIDEPENLVFIGSALDENGNSMFDVLNTVTFKTELTLQARVVKSNRRRTAISERNGGRMDAESGSSLQSPGLGSRRGKKRNASGEEFLGHRGPGDCGHTHF